MFGGKRGGFHLSSTGIDASVREVVSSRGIFPENRCKCSVADGGEVFPPDSTAFQGNAPELLGAVSEVLVE